MAVNKEEARPASRKLVVPILFALLLVVAIPSATVGSTEDSIYLKPNSSAFWDGDYVDTTTDPNEGEESYTYGLVTEDGGDRLRVGLNVVLDYRRNSDDSVRTEHGGVHPDADGAFGRAFDIEIFEDDIEPYGVPDTTDPVVRGTSDYSLELFICFNRDANGDGEIGPGEFCEPYRVGKVADQGGYCNFEGNTGTCESPSGYSVALPGPSSGKWIIKVTPKNVTGWRFDVRARLEKVSTPSTTQPENKPQLPNLRSIPPFELTFFEPVVQGGFLAGRDPVPGDGCTEGERADALVESQHIILGMCLRFSAGPENTGPGQLEVRYHPGDETVLTRPAFQRLYDVHGEQADCDTSTAAVDDCLVGTLEFHDMHAHWHYPFFTYQLFTVSDSTPTSGQLNPVKLGDETAGTKVGFCPSDDRLVIWERFYQERKDRWENDRVQEFPDNGSCLSPTHPMMGLSVGWSDLYEWARAEQFVEFPTVVELPPDGSEVHKPLAGYYVLQSTVDKDNSLHESNEHDNASYVYFSIDQEGGIQIIERGYGRSHVDPDKRMVIPSAN